MQKSSGYIDASARVFNAPGQLFNIFEQQRHKYLKQLPITGPTNPPDLIPDGTAVRRNFDDFVPFVTESLPPPVIKRQAVVGSFSAVRAARILHQYLVNFWSDPDILLALNNPAPLVYSADTLTQMYADFLLFNYLPAKMTPTQQQFTEIVQPNGIFEQPLGLTPAAVVPEDVLNEATLPPPIPFGESLTPFCNLVNIRVSR